MAQSWFQNPKSTWLKYIEKSLFLLWDLFLQVNVRMITAGIMPLWAAHKQMYTDAAHLCVSLLHRLRGACLVSRLAKHNAKKKKKKSGSENHFHLGGSVNKLHQKLHLCCINVWDSDKMGNNIKGLEEEFSFLWSTRRSLVAVLCWNVSPNS